MLIFQGVLHADFFLAAVRIYAVDVSKKMARVTRLHEDFRWRCVGMTYIPW